MGVQERKERDKEAQRQRILDAAAEIIAEEGMAGLSIRKIAARIEYTPGVVYHYFAGKDEIIDQLLQRSYSGMVQGLGAVQEGPGQPEVKLKQSLGRYIDMALAHADEYRNVMLTDSPGVLNHTSVLFRGAAKERKAMELLCRSIESFPMAQDKPAEEIELTAQVVWSATFGLIIRLIIENGLPEDQKRRLIDHHLDMIVRCITAK